MGADEADGGTRGWWVHGRPMGAASHRPHARSFRPMGAVSRQMPQKPPGQIPSQHVRENDSSYTLFSPLLYKHEGHNRVIFLALQ